MTNRTTTGDRSEALVQEMTERMVSVTRTLRSWLQTAPQPLQVLEANTQRLLHELGAALLTGLVQHLAPARPHVEVPCPCGQAAAFQRQRCATVTTVFGRISYQRASYHCRTCGLHHAPLDQQLHVAAGGLSLGLQEVNALLGATQDSFAQAAALLEKLTRVVAVSQQRASGNRRRWPRSERLRCAHGHDRAADARRPARRRATASTAVHLYGWRTCPYSRPRLEGTQGRLRLHHPYPPLAAPAKTAGYPGRAAELRGGVRPQRIVSLELWLEAAFPATV